MRSWEGGQGATPVPSPEEIDPFGGKPWGSFFASSATRMGMGWCGGLSRRGVRQMAQLNWGMPLMSPSSVQRLANRASEACSCGPRS